MGVNVCTLVHTVAVSVGVLVCMLLWACLVCMLLWVC